MHACVAPTREVMVVVHVVVVRCGHAGEGRPHTGGGQRAGGNLKVAPSRVDQAGLPGPEMVSGPFHAAGDRGISWR